MGFFSTLFRSIESNSDILSAEKLDNDFIKKPSIDRYNRLISFPEKLPCGQKLYRSYVNNSIVDTRGVDFESLSLVNPLLFEQETDGRIGIYQGEALLGYMESGRGEKMTSDFLARNDIVCGYLSKIDNYSDELFMDVAYYRNYRKRPEPEHSHESIIEELKSCVELSLTIGILDDEQTIVDSMLIGDKELYCVDANYNLYIVDKRHVSSIIKRVSLGDAVEIIKEPTNQYDSKAVVVKCAGETIGYLYNEYQELANYAFNNNGIVKGYITLLESDKYNVNVNIALYFYL